MIEGVSDQDKIRLNCCRVAYVSEWNDEKLRAFTRFALDGLEAKKLHDEIANIFYGCTYRKLPLKEMRDHVLDWAIALES